jgi:hypothetical protein
VDKGANQPNVFLDPKSAESAAPWFSTGVRDDYVQRRFLQASLGYWRDPENNPASSRYEGRMVETGATHVWTWDARPWPAFPQRLDLWSDGDNHLRGHWITGRMATAGLGEIVAEICVAAGVEAFDVDRLHGSVDGYLLDAVGTGRQALQPLMLAYDFDAVESGGRLRFAHRAGVVAAAVAAEDMVEQTPRFVVERESAADFPTAVRLGFLDADGAYEATAVESRLGANRPDRVEASEAALALSADAARRIADGWLAESGEPTETARFALAPSAVKIEPGDVLALPFGEGDAAFRVERVDDAGPRRVVARRLRRRAAAVESPEFRRRGAATVSVGPVEVALLDLPTLPAPAGGGPRVAVFADPWPGAASIYLAEEHSEPQLLAQVDRPAVMGVLSAPLARGAPHRWMRGEALVRLYGGGLVSVTPEAVLRGANLAALRGPSGAWEVLQFTGAELLDADLWRLSGLLRGQAGTEGAVGDPAPTGAAFVLLDGALGRLDTASATRGLVRRHLVGPSVRRPDHESYTAVEAVFGHEALLPPRPAWLAASRDVEGLSLTWAARRREDFDGWAEASWEGATDASFRVAVSTADGERLTRIVSGEALRLSTEELDAAGAKGRLEAGVAEISAVHGRSAEARITVDG